MTKRNKIIYWIATVWLASAMIASGIQQIFSIGGFVEIMQGLGYPEYFSVILGIWKLAGVAILLIPGFLLLKEWAYAGFVFTMAGAAISHVASGHELADIFPPALLLVLTLVSWYFRPNNRKIAATVPANSLN